MQILWRFWAYNKLEDECESFSGVDNVVEGDDIGVFELFEQGRLPDGCERRSLLLLQSDLFKGNNLIR